MQKICKRYAKNMGVLCKWSASTGLSGLVPVLLLRTSHRLSCRAQVGTQGLKRIADGMGTKAKSRRSRNARMLRVRKAPQKEGKKTFAFSPGIKCRIIF